MSALAFVVNDRFIFRTIKSYTTNPSRQWSNSYEFLANTSGGADELTALATALVGFEVLIHNTFTHFVRTTVSTWEADSVPYDPDSFLVFEEDTNGLRDTSGELEPITTCWSVARQPFSGRLGHIFYRGVLSQADTEAPAGITKLASPGTMSTLLDGSLGDSNLSDYIGLTAAGPLVLAMINKTGTNTRLVSSLVSSGVSQLPVDHAWFNRTSP